jgi:hypothetical protein
MYRIYYIITLILGLLVAPVSHAKISIYGLMDMNIAMYDNGLTNTDPKLVIKPGRSRIGFKDNQGLEGGGEFFYRIEWGTSLYNTTGAATDTDIDSNNKLELTSRLAYAGLSGLYGKIYAGRVYSPFYTTIAKTDIEIAGTGAIAVEDVAIKRVSNTLVYQAHEYEGLEVFLAASTTDKVPNESTNTYEENSVNATTYAIQYSINKLTFGVAAYYSKEVNTKASKIADNREALGYSLTYKLNNNISIAGNYIASRKYMGSTAENNIKDPNDDVIGDERDVAYSGTDIAIKFKIGYNMQLNLILGNRGAGIRQYAGLAANDRSAKDSKTAHNISYSYQLGYNTLAYFVYENVEQEDVYQTSKKTTSINFFAGISKQF